MMKLAFVGDVMLGRLVNQMLKQSDPAYPWGNTLSILSLTDLRICNLECVLSDFGQPWPYTPKVFFFRSDEKNIQTLQIAKMDILSIANNHVLDYDYEGLARMLTLLKNQKMIYTGAGENLSEASNPVIYEIRGKKIGLIAFTDNEPEWEAKENRPGVYYVPVELRNRRMQNLFENIENLKKKVDFLILSAHWGPNWGYKPPIEHVSAAHAMIDAGVDLIFGHSGHVFRGVEMYKNRFIIYSAGDFIDDYAVDEIEKNDESFIFILEVDDEMKMSLNLYPTVISQFQVNLASQGRKEKILSKMKSLCKDLGSNLQCLSDRAVLKNET